MKNLSNKKQFFIGLLLFPVIFAILMFSLPTNFETVSVGSYNMVLNEDEETSNFYSLYVISNSYTIPFQIIFLDNLKFTDYYEKTTNLSNSLKQGKIAKETSQSQSLLASYYYASLIDDDITMFDYHLKSVIIYENLFSFKVGDEITKVDNLYVSDLSYYEFLIYLKNASLNNNTLKLTLKDEKTYTIDANTFYNRAYIYPNYHLEHENIYKKTQTIGPSAGLIYTIKNYVDLINLNTNNDIIAATGTINYYDSDNIRVGMIGGLKQKIYGLRKTKVDVLFIPLWNKTDEIVDLTKKYLKNTQIYYVSYFSEVVDILHELYD